eukprot:7380999-Prymnesium_polylepis.1
MSYAGLAPWSRSWQSHQEPDSQYHGKTLRTQAEWSHPEGFVLTIRSERSGTRGAANRSSGRAQPRRRQQPRCRWVS